MFIKKWLEEPLQKRTCQMIIDETLWELGIKPKTVERKVESMGDPMHIFSRVYDDNDFYQQLLDQEFNWCLELCFWSYYNALERGEPFVYWMQNSVGSDGHILKGFNHEAATEIFRILQSLVREKYAIIQDPST